jgi:WD40 repeat protein
MLDAHFAHEGTILRLALAPDGRSLLSCADDRSAKLWSVPELEQQMVLSRQSDWVSAAAFLSTNRIALGRLDGSLEAYGIGSKP